MPAVPALSRPMVSGPMLSGPAVSGPAVWASVGTAPAETVEQDSKTDPDRPWVTIVWNDPINLTTYVTYVFMNYFKYSRAKAEKLMLAVHNEGRAVVSNGNREEMEVDATAMHSYGLWATIQKDD